MKAAQAWVVEVVRQDPERGWSSRSATSTPGFLAGLQTITRATIAVHSTDDGGPANYSILIGDALQTLTVPNLDNNVVETIPLNAAALADLAADGIISVGVRSNTGIHREYRLNF